MLKTKPTTSIRIDNHTERAITPEQWLSLLPGVVAQIEPEQHEEFVLKILRNLESVHVNMASCVIDEYAAWW